MYECFCENKTFGGGAGLLGQHCTRPLDIIQHVMFIDITKLFECSNTVIEVSKDGATNCLHLQDIYMYKYVCKCKAYLCTLSKYCTTQCTVQYITFHHDVSNTSQ